MVYAYLEEKKKINKNLLDRVGVVGGGGKGSRGKREVEKKEYLALARNGGLNHLLKIFNDISVFLV